MMKKSIKISCPGGLEPRPIAELVQVASKYESKIYLETDTKRVNAKSIMGMMRRAQWRRSSAFSRKSSIL